MVVPIVGGDVNPVTWAELAKEALLKKHKCVLLLEERSRSEAEIN